jgi:hypothetical protein
MVIFELRLTQVRMFCYEEVDVRLDLDSQQIQPQSCGYLAAFISDEVTSIICHNYHVATIYK